MKSILLFFTLAFLCTSAFGQYSTTETLKFNSKVFNQERELKVSIPSDYYEYPNRKYKVVYLFDAQSESLYDFTKQTISYLGGISIYVDPVILIGVVSKNRHFEFLPKNKTNLPLKDYWAQVKLGGADSLAISLKNEILPLINARYRTNGYNIGVGHSLGGSFVTYSMFKFAQIFNAGVAVSPNFYYDEEQLLTTFKNELNKNVLKDKVLYICYGQGDRLEDKFKPSTIKFAKLLAKTNISNFHYKVQSLNNNSHSTIPMEGIFKGLVFVNEPLTIPSDKEAQFLEDKTQNYFDYLKNYFKQRTNNTGLILPTVGDINRLAYNCLYSDRKEDAIKIMEWAILLYPDDANLFDSMGEFQMANGNKEEAKNYYIQGLEIIENQKKLLQENIYQAKINWFKGKIAETKEK